MLTFTTIIPKPNPAISKGRIKTMKVKILILSLLIFSVCLPVFGQKKSATTAKFFDTTWAGQEPKFTDLGINIMMDDSGSATVNLVTTESSQTVGANSASQFYSAITTKSIDPIITIFPTPNNSIEEIEKFAEPLRRSGKNRIRIASTDGQFLVIPGKLTKNDMPNPLFLLVKLDNDGDLFINGEPHGNQADPEQLVSRLKLIFRSREMNYVARPGTDTVDKSVHLLLPKGSTFSEIQKLESIVRGAGSDRVFLSFAEENQLKITTLDN